MERTVSEISRAYCISTRALRYYEQLGLLRSRRREGYAYRVYDEEAVNRLERILFLRSLRLPLSSIALLLDCRDPERALAVLRGRMREIDGEMGALRAARDALQRLERMTAEALPAAAPLPAAPPSLHPSDKKEDLPMTSHPALQDVRILTLPRMAVASAHVIGPNPEQAADAMLRAFLRQSDLAARKPDARVFGFNNPCPASEDEPYGYEYWVTIPDGMEVPAPLAKKIMPGGLYAAHAIRMGDFQEWGWLGDWAAHSADFAPALTPGGMGGLLEEHLNFVLGWPEDARDQQLDLLYPVAPRRS